MLARAGRLPDFDSFTGGSKHSFLVSTHCSDGWQLTGSGFTKATSSGGTTSEIGSDLLAFPP
jgi:hypothetical protein